MDCYTQRSIPISFKKDCDHLGLYDIDFHDVTIEPWMETKGKDGSEYYPAHVITIPICRDPITDMTNIFLPLLILIFFNSFVVFSTEFDNLIANSSIVLLAFLQ